MANQPTNQPFWRSFRLFEALDDPVLTKIANAAQRRHWPSGTTLFQRGDTGDYLVALASGRIRLAVGSAQGKELVLRHAEAGDIFGELSLFDGAPRSAEAVAVIDSAGFVLPKSDYDAITLQEPSLCSAVTHYLCRMLRDTTGQLESLALYTLEARVARFLLFTLRQIHGDDLPPNPLLLLEINQSDIAAVLGASRPKVNRALQSLRDAGIIQKSGDAMECNVALLHSIADPRLG
ncbi:Crp/Fnr family transcriptional regulator [Pseudorhodobacter sp. W20_MBD10_FR17]|uniref:Crp/Fnr family transcriptional regulator n=1 Tax=Pseudorhodobacter sp. W20_MBD10_FR17 TaxID=3240266 RepID=UPI003F9AEB69